MPNPNIDRAAPPNSKKAKKSASKKGSKKS